MCLRDFDLYYPESPSHEVAKHSRYFYSCGSTLWVKGLTVLSIEDSCHLHQLHSLPGVFTDFVTAKKGHFFIVLRQCESHCFGILMHNNCHLFTGNGLIKSKFPIAYVVYYLVAACPLNVAHVVSIASHIGEAALFVSANISLGNPLQYGDTHSATNGHVRLKIALEVPLDKPRHTTFSFPSGLQYL